MTRQTAAGQPVEIFFRPAELMNAGAQGDRAVDHPARQHDVCTLCQGTCNRKSTEIGIDAGQGFHRWYGLPGEHFNRTGCRQIRRPAHQVITGDHGNGQIQSCRIDQGPYRRRAGSRINASRIRNDLYTLPGNLRQVGLEHGRNEIGGIAEFGFGRPGARHDRHGDFGQVVIDDVIEIPASQQLRRRDRRFTPESTGSANTNDLIFAHLFHERVLPSLTYENKSV